MEKEVKNPEQVLFPPATWRLVKTSPAAGAWNMAVDEAILEAVGEAASRPTLRLYAWAPPCLSLGYAQPCADVDRSALVARGWELVRRPTGGRAILHTDELTYSVVTPPGEPRTAGGVLASYRRLARALVLALRYLALPAHTKGNYNLGSDADPNGPVCFEVPSNWEITVQGKKLIGSAQVRKKIGILQHGTLPLTGDLTRITQVLAYPDRKHRESAAQKLLDHATTVETALQKTVPWEEAATAYVKGFQNALNLTFEESTLSPQELSRAAELVQEKYRTAGWNERI